MLVSSSEANSVSPNIASHPTTTASLLLPEESVAFVDDDSEDMSWSGTFSSQLWPLLVADLLLPSLKSSAKPTSGETSSPSIAH